MSRHRGSPLVRRTEHVILPDPGRVVSTDFFPAAHVEALDRPRGWTLLDRVMALPEHEVVSALEQTLASFTPRHRDLTEILETRYARVAHRIDGPPVSRERRLLIGAFLSQEYGVEAAAVFNPSMVEHPDQSRLARGTTRFVMSVRGVGEGHVSCIEFRTGTVDAVGTVVLDPQDPLAARGRTLPPAAPPAGWEAHDAEAYTITFAPETPIDARVILPGSAAESHGLEDLRLVRFTADDGSTCYLGTYTAFDGSAIASHLLRTTDFTTFEMTPLTGPAARNKGMALFPRTIGGDHVALSRWDGETSSLARSSDLLHWDHAGTLRDRVHPWEIVQTGNCGSPLETPAGWLVLTHGVGPMRRYVLGAMLLDLDDPGRVLGSLAEPLLVPRADERDGYVPNVVYSCGGMLHGGVLVLPY
ncbi:MAG: glycosidase-like protein, partial [Cellulomonadaceae bacterium]|nr:glycosidase-like protein [Cellulomonadaceae bacterium]